MKNSMAKTPAAASTPELHPKRPVYTTYAEIIRTLVTAAQARVRQDKQPDPVPPVPTSRKIRQLANSYRWARKAARKAEAKLSNMNLSVNDQGGVDWSYSYRNKLSEKPGAMRQKRLDKIQQMRLRATLDTMDMTPPAAKGYLLKLERQLATV